MRKYNIFLSFAIILLVTLTWVNPVSGQNADQPVIVLDVEGVINPFTSRYLERGLSIARQQDAVLLILKLNTPGGLESSMRDMVQLILQSPVPVAVFVTPEGARATSAGLFILMAGDIAAMSPATNLGAATPVAMGGEMDEVMSEKALSDAAALIRGLAERHNRNVAWVESAVLQSLSLTASEALEDNVIDYVALDLNDLLNQLDGQEVVGFQFNLADTYLQVENMNWVERFYHTITEPNIAYLLLSIGTLFLLAELSDPGLSVAGIGAVLCFIIGFMALGSLPVNWAAVGLLVVSLIMFVVALLTDTEVIVTVAGLVPFILGSLLLFTPFQPESPAVPELRVSLWLVILMALLIVFFSLIVLRAILKASKLPPRMGAQRLIGKNAIAETDLTPAGQVLIENQTWSATSISGNVKKGEAVQIISVTGVRLSVSPIKNEEK